MKSKVWYELGSGGKIWQHRIDCDRRSEDCGEHTVKEIVLGPEMSEELSNFISHCLIEYSSLREVIGQIANLARNGGVIV